MRGPFFDELHVGQEFMSRSRVITQTDVVLFANLAGLLSPMFTDRDHARAQGFEDCLTPGPLLLAYSVGLTEDMTYETVIAALAFDELRFHAPVHVGQSIWVETTIRELRRSTSRPGTGVVTMDHLVRKTGGGAASTYTRTLLYRASDEAASSQVALP